MKYPAFERRHKKGLSTKGQKPSKNLPNNFSLDIYCMAFVSLQITTFLAPLITFLLSSRIN